MQPTRCFVLGSLGLALSAAPLEAWATELRGKLEILPEWLAALDQRLAAQPEQGPPTRFWEVGNGAASVGPIVVDPSQEIGILVRSAEGKPLDPLPTAEPEIAVRNLAFQPAVTFVPEGKSLVVRNFDIFDHDFVVEPDKGGAELPREDLDGGRSFRVRFNTSGLYVLRCRNFPFLRGYVYVDKEPARLVHAAPDGSFSLGDLPPGKYTLAVFNATAAASSASTPAAGWIARPCTVEVPPPPREAGAPLATSPAVPGPPRPAPTASARAALSGEPTGATATPPALQLTVRLGAQGATETVECVVAPLAPLAAPPVPTPAGRSR